MYRREKLMPLFIMSSFFVQSVIIATAIVLKDKRKETLYKGVS